MAIKDQVVIYFIAKFTNDLEGKNVEETNYESFEQLRADKYDILTWILHVDGSFNAKKNGAEIILMSMKGHKIPYILIFDFKSSNSDKCVKHALIIYF